METEGASAELVAAHAFRHEYGRLVAQLTRSFGFRRVESVEDAVQAALLAALHSWPKHGVPAEPSAWLFRAARNKLLDELRAARVRKRQADAARTEPAVVSEPPPPAHFEEEVADAELRMLFACADPSVPRESQLVLALKILCGFSTREIALRLLTSEDNVQKRLGRGREQLQKLGDRLVDPPSDLASRRESVEQMVYLLFNEGYSSTLDDRLIRRELCEEAIRLGLLLAESQHLGAPSSRALVALMFLHAARFDARIDGHGGLLLLQEQDRSLWDRELMAIGFSHLQQSAAGPRFSRYHAEAAIAAEHCVATSYAETRWSEIVDLYAMLERFEPSPLHTLNKAIALAEWQGPEKGLEVLQAVKPPAWLSGYYLWDATLGELWRRAGQAERAKGHLERALEMAPHPAEQALLRRRLELCGSLS